MRDKSQIERLLSTANLLYFFVLPASHPPLLFVGGNKILPEKYISNLKTEVKVLLLRTNIQVMTSPAENILPNSRDIYIPVEG